MQNLREELSVVDYLQSKGYVFKKKGNKFFTNSPFVDNDRTPSFCVFPDGAWKDFSSGRAGNVITLIRHFKDNPKTLDIPSNWIAPKEYPKKIWSGIPHKFLEMKDFEREKIVAYAALRGITSGYKPGCWFSKSDTGFDKHLAIMFPHQNNGIITGAKFRSLPEDEQRFSSSGQLGFYILEHEEKISFESKVYYLVEGEANANSLWEYIKTLRKSCLVMSAGAVTAIPRTLPTKENTTLLIDYDGNETKYQQRVAKYAHLNVTPLKLILPKGEDLNTLYCSKKIHLINI